MLLAFLPASLRFLFLLGGLAFTLIYQSGASNPSVPCLGASRLQVSPLPFRFQLASLGTLVYGLGFSHLDALAFH